MSMLDNAAGEILRNLRMVISTKRIDIDEIVLIDSLAKLPKIDPYCKNVGLTAPMENVQRLFTGGSKIPVVTQAAMDKGFDATSFITLNGILTMPIPEANLIMGESNILTAMANENSGKFGNLVAGVVGVAAAVWMIGIGGWWMALDFQKKNDTAQLNDKKYDSAKQLIADEALWQMQVENINKNLEMLPKTALKSADVIKQMFEQVVDKVDSVSDFKVNNDEHEIKTTISVKDLPTFNTFKETLTEDGYFAVGDGITVVNVSDPGEGGATPVQYTKVDIKLTVTPKAIADAEAAAANAPTDDSGNNNSSTPESSASGENSGTESSAG